MRSVQFDPRLFIGPPFTACPNCTRPEFGTLTVSKRTVTRRCRACWHTATRPLPPIRKKIIYLDQMAYSGMAKTLDPVWAAKSSPQAPYWANQFDALDRAFKLQLIVCPSSTVHEKESVLAQQPAMLRGVYDHLGGGVSFQHPIIIHQHQLSVAFRKLLAGETPNYDLRRDLVLYGEPDTWMERLRISVNMAGLVPEADVQRNVRQRSHTAMLKYFDKWKNEPARKFADWYQEERMGSSINFASLYNEHAQLMQRVFAGELPMTEDAIFPRLEAGVVSALMFVAQDAGFGPGERLPVVAKFLFSDVAYDAPANDIAALLMAALARKAASGQRRPPSPGMWNDITAVATFLPYCDAMYLDNECAGLLREEPLRTKLSRFGTAIFSSKSRHAFLDYLLKLEADAGVDHLRTVAEVYGDDWSTPYRELLVNERARAERQ